MQPMPDDIDKPSSPNSSELTTRLLGRYVKPVGVIDTQHPQQLQARTAGWIAQRFGLLEHWRRRYESDESAPAADQSLVFASAPGSHEDRAASEPVIAADTRTAIARSSSPMERVRRPGARLPDAWAPSTLAKAQSQPSRQAVTTKDSEVISRQQEPLGDTRSPASTSKYSNARNLNVPHQGRGNVAPLKPTTSPMPMPRLSRPSGEGSMARQEIRRTAAAQPPLGTERKEQEPARFVDGQAFMANGKGRGGVESGAGTVRQAMPLVQRRTEPAPIDDGTGATRPLDINPKRTPVVAELAPPASPPPVLIWRAGGSSNSMAASPAASSPLPHRAMSPEPVIARQASTSSGPAEPSSTAATGPAPVATGPRASASDLDMAQLAEQVSRMLSRQLAVARERRGMKR